MKLAELEARVFYIPATQVAIDVAGTDLSSNVAMLGAFLAVTDFISEKGLEEALVERFGGAKFVASGTTAALDDMLKSKFAKLTQLIEKNMEVIMKAKAAVWEYAV